MPDMQTLGVDLAAEATNTAACLIEWQDGCATVLDIATRCDDRQLLQMIQAADRVGIDVPFGWPNEFIDAIASHRSLGRWPGSDRTSLRFRATDRFVTSRTRLWPLSVSTDRIGVTAMRCAYLLDQIAQKGEPVDRSGAGKVVEVYPAAALAVWGFDPKRYKKIRGRQNLGRLVEQLVGNRPWLALTSQARRQCEESDDVFDALISSLVARAVALGLTHMPPPEHVQRARLEGWIHLPISGRMDDLTMN
jgi:predicted nuclease with RNAse H fold